MLQITPSMKIFVCVQSVDFRKGIDGLAAICRQQLQKKPLEGALFVFQGGSKKSIKLLTYDGQGFWLCTKRLSKGRFLWWPDQPEIMARQLQTLLWNGNPEQACFSEDWRKISDA